MSAQPDNPLSAHLRECDDCRAAAPPIAALAAALDASLVAGDAAALSRRVLAQAAPELQVRARAAFWRRLVRALAAALVPLPLLIAADFWVLGWLYDLAAAWLPSGLAAYLVLSYAASLLVLTASVYGAIPLLLARPVPESDATPA